MIKQPIALSLLLAASGLVACSSMHSKAPAPLAAAPAPMTAPAGTATRGAPEAEPPVPPATPLVLQTSRISTAPDSEKIDINNQGAPLGQSAAAENASRT